jgi:hypothetical protein
MDCKGGRADIAAVERLQNTAIDDQVRTINFRSLSRRR